MDISRYKQLLERIAKASVNPLLKRRAIIEAQAAVKATVEDTENTPTIEEVVPVNTVSVEESPIKDDILADPDTIKSSNKKSKKRQA